MMIANTRNIIKDHEKNIVIIKGSNTKHNNVENMASPKRKFNNKDFMLLPKLNKYDYIILYLTKKAT